MAGWSICSTVVAANVTGNKPTVTLGGLTSQGFTCGEEVISKTIKKKINAAKVILYRRASTKAQMTTSCRDQLNAIKAIYPDFSIAQSTIGDVAEVKSGRVDAEIRIASGLGKALRLLIHQPGAILLVSELNRLARRTDVFQLIQAQGLGDRIYDATTGLCLNDSIKLGSHATIEKQTNRQRASRIQGMVRFMKDGGTMGNHDIARQSSVGISTKRRIAKVREADVLSTVSQMVVYNRGRKPTYEEICDELDRRDIRTGQGKFFTPERLAQLRKANKAKWNHAFDSHHRPRRRIRRVVFNTVIELRKRRLCMTRMNLLLTALAHKLNRTNFIRPKCLDGAFYSHCYPIMHHTRLKRTNECRGPPMNLSTSFAAQT